MRTLKKLFLKQSQMFSLPHVPATGVNTNYYLGSIKPAKVRLRSPEEDMVIVGQDIARATAKVIVKYSEDYDAKAL